VKKKARGRMRNLLQQHHAVPAFWLSRHWLMFAELCHKLKLALILC